MNSHVNCDAHGVIQPVQERGRLMQQKLVDATLTLLEEKSFEALSIAEITAAAGVATGSFYRRFKSKEAMLPFLYEEYDARYAAWSNKLSGEARFDDPMLEGRLMALVEATYDFFQRNAGLMRALHLNSRVDPSIVPETSHARRQFHYQTVAALIDEKRVGAKATKEAARAIMLMLISALSEHIFYPAQTPARAARLGRKQFIDAFSLAAAAIAAPAVKPAS